MKTTLDVPGLSLVCTGCREPLGAEQAFCSACLARQRGEWVASLLAGPMVLILAALVVGAAALAGISTRRVSLLRTELDTTTRRLEISTGQVARLTQLKTSLEKDLGDLRVNYVDARKTLKEKETLIAMASAAGVDSPHYLAGPPVPTIDARVAAVKSNVTPELVLLSVGSDDKVEKGFHFSIYRGTKFVGKVVVEKVLSDSCGCRVLFTDGDARILAGDSAATRLQ